MSTPNDTNRPGFTPAATTPGKPGRQRDVTVAALATVLLAGLGPILPMPLKQKVDWLRGYPRWLQRAAQGADSGDVARSFRDHVARCSDMMSPA